MAEMTGAFGILRNAGTQPLHVTGGWSPAAGRVELHETVKNASGSMQMQKAQNGSPSPRRVPSSSRREPTTSCSSTQWPR